MSLRSFHRIAVAHAILWFWTGTGWAQAGGLATGVSPRSIAAIGYIVGGGSTKVDLKNTGLLPQARGNASVEAKPGVSTVEAGFDGLHPPTPLGAEFLTYVLWTVSPEGRAINLGGIPYDKNGHGRLKATTPLQSFSLFVTAEPYSAVREPSEMLILENAPRKNTKGKRFIVNDYKLMSRSQYQKLGNPLSLVPDIKNVPIEMYEARNAIDIAASRGADKYAPEIFEKAGGALTIAEKALARKASRKEIVSSARLASQLAEDSRALSIDRQQQERIVAERTEAAARAKADAEARAAAEAAAARRRAEAEAQRQAELVEARQASLRAASAAREAEIRAQAEIAASRARMREEAAQAEAENAHRAAEELRTRLFDQFNRILETQDTPRGLVVTMADVLFDTGKHDLRMDAREKLARFSGIVLSNPGLAVEVGGHTDSVGTDEYNLKLSQQRAQTVRDFLLRQGLPEDSITAVGYGRDLPVSDNRSAEGRQKNRRVELLVSGQVIGGKVGK